MSAVDEYRKQRDMCADDDRKDPDIAVLADAAIAELEAENKRLNEKCEQWHDEVIRLVAELADWKALYELHVRPKCGSDAAFKAQVAYDMGCIDGMVEE